MGIVGQSSPKAKNKHSNLNTEPQFMVKGTNMTEIEEKQGEEDSSQIFM